MSRQDPGRRRPGAAALEEQAEILNLRGQADRTAAEAALTLTELLDRADLARQPGILARRLVTDARHTAVRTLRATPGRIAGQRSALGTVLVVVPALAAAVAVAVVVARQRAQAQA